MMASSGLLAWLVGTALTFSVLSTLVLLYLLWRDFRRKQLW